MTYCRQNLREKFTLMKVFLTFLEKKCCLIQLAKMLDKDYYGTKAIELDNRLEGGATLTLDENERVKLIEGAAVKPTRFRDIYGTLNSLPSGG